MKNIKYFFICLLLNMGFSSTSFSKSFGSFQIAAGSLQNNALYISNVNLPTNFRFLAQVLRDEIGFNTYEDGTCQVTAVLQIGTTYTDISDPIYFTNVDFQNQSIVTGNAVKSNILATIPANTLTGTIRLRLDYYDSNAGTNVVKYSTTGYSMAFPPVVPPPSFVPPVDGCVPIYEYVSSTGRVLTKAYSSYVGYTYGRIFGFLFETQVVNTVPLYAFINNTVANDHYYGLSNSAKTGYTYYGILGYVYANQVAKSLPVYANHKSSNGGQYLFDNRPGTFAGYTFEDVQFYLLQNTQSTTYPLPEEESRELYQYLKGSTGDHFYTTYKDNYLDYVYEKVLGYVSTIQKPNTVPLYRYYNMTYDDHYMTTVQNNYGGYIYEGIVGYVYLNSQSTTVPVWQYMNGSLWDHYYNTVNQNFGGYTNEGIKFHILPYSH